MRKRTICLLALLFGVLVGAAGFTFVYAEGHSYLSNDPKTCVNCHIMQPQFDSWQKSSHHGVATCNDCHLPQSFPEKYISKARNGWNHSVAFTLQNFAEPIRITEANAKTLQENCVRCHSEFTHEIQYGASHEGDPMRCTHCHRSAGHGATAGLGGPMRDAEIPQEAR